MKTSNKNRVFLALTAIVMATTAVHAQKGKVVAPAEKAAPIAATKDEPKSEAKPAVEAGAEFKPLGFLGFAYAEGTYVLTCGGPKVGFTYGSFGMAAGFYPSLVYSDAWRGTNGALVNPLRPSLGAGIEVSFKKIALIAPVYYLSPNSYYYTIGIGYKF